MLLVVPVPVILVSHIAVIALSAMSQTLSDGSSAATGSFRRILFQILSQLRLSLRGRGFSRMFDCSPDSSVQLQIAPFSGLHS